MARVAIRLTLLGALIALVGCSSGSAFPKTYPVTGSIKLKGKAVEGALVTFQIEGGKENAVGTTDSNGEFKLSMFRPGDGAIPGQYRVAVTKDPNPTAPAATPPPGQIASGDLDASYSPPTDSGNVVPSKKKSEIPPKYSNDQTSGLRATVVESATENRFDFELN